MSYVKTQWVNNTTLINDTNLNKMEQGIYDNSLVVDAVTNTLNPTDTETYKTAELTEGQITDVIGVNDILIKGQTSQNGEPTPSSPVDVNVVSGSNVVNTSSKNLFEPRMITTTKNGITCINNWDGTFTLDGTASENISFRLDQSTYLGNDNLKKYNGTYTLSCNELENNMQLRVMQDQTYETEMQMINNQPVSVTFNKDNCFMYVWVASGKTLNNLTIRPQLEKNSTATTYEPHQGKELPLDLGKNLFNEDNYLVNTGINSDGTIATSNNNSLFYIPVKYGKKYTISFVDNGVSGNILYGFSNDKPVLNGTCTYNVLDITTLNNHTFTPVNANNKYLCIRLNVVNTNQYQAMEDIQVELGSEATKYVPYDPDPIELCKIGDYQDYFYRDNNNGKWYLHKEVGKYILDGTNNAIIGKSGTTNNNLFISSVISDILIPTNNNESINVYCSHFIGGKSANYLFLNNTLGIAVRTTKDLSIGVTLENTNNTIALINTWLASNNVITYYPLATATDTEITGTLKEQLEAIYNAPLYEQTNITQTNNDLPMILDITACKDNINGIKAFIRK